VVEAFLALRRKGYELMLVLVTDRGEYYRQVAGYIREDGAEKGVVLTSFVSEEELVLLYNEALCLLMPSLYEGFGLPALEAMACGTPAIITRASSLPEVAGDAGIYVMPDRDDQIVTAVERLIADAGWRKRISRLGIQRAGLFSWEETARRTLQVYQQAAGR
jgi:glycosyltransferase involved in cell wall biosynthesis